MSRMKIAIHKRRIVIPPSGNELKLVENSSELEDCC